MRPITVRYAGECSKCSAELAIGAQAIYERRAGIYCLGCAPTDPEEIREARQVGREARAQRYEEWAEKRRAKAAPTLKLSEHFRGDIAFNTQPGHIPFRARLIKAQDRAFENLRTADRFEAKARSLRHVVVAGDRERQRQAERDAVRPLLRVGMRVRTAIYGDGVIVRINRKTATIGSTGTSGTYKVACDLSWITPLEKAS